MKIGILTFHHTTNYGATLQAYALWKIIKHQGHEVEIIDYRPDKAVKLYLKEIQPIKINRRHKRLDFNSRALGNLVKSWKMRNFLVSQMKLSPKKYSTGEALKKFDFDYDLVICGSDQVWSLDSFRGFDPSFYLDFIDDQANCRKISYAASFGKTKELGKYKEVICKLISRFDVISVRETNSIQLLQQECNQQAEKVLDPTFLIEYSEILSFPQVEEKYILIYAASMTLEQQNFVRSIAKQKKMKIISVGFPSKIADKNLIGVSPEEWLGYFSKASYIVTHLYHGTIFAIIFKKNFTVFASEARSDKIKDLLENIGLENRLLSEAELDSVQDYFLPIDYTDVYERLSTEVDKSKAYLFKAINGR